MKKVLKVWFLLLAWGCVGVGLVVCLQPLIAPTPCEDAVFIADQCHK